MRPDRPHTPEPEPRAAELPETFPNVRGERIDGRLVGRSDAADVSVESVMAEYVERLEAGESPDAAGYLRDYPQHAAELESFFRNHHWLAEESPPQLPSLVGTRIGPYEIEAEIARGGMGIVYRARQADLERPVALKLIRAGVLAGHEERRRFRIEAAAAAQLEHPGIIQIHDVGSWQGHEYFSMTLVEGETLQDVVDRDAFDDNWTAGVVRDVARAVAFAHRRGIVHRDLKPANILLGDDGRAMIADFGLAKWHREGTMLTRTGQVLGTPHYMSPEQACGRGDAGSPSDIYSLGAILYALLTGRPPHDGPSAAEVLRSVLQDEPPTPRSIRRAIPADLEKICLQALRYDPKERYVTAEAMADDLDRFLSGEPPHGVTSGLIDRVARELRRDQHQDHFEAWGRTLMLIGVIIFAAHAAMQTLFWLGPGRWTAYWAPRAVMFGLIAAVIYRARGCSLLPRRATERPLWSVWLGYLATLGVINGLVFFHGFDQDLVFPIASALSGFGFLAMAGHVWGGSALIGGGFLLLAAIAASLPAWGPLLLGSGWLLGMFVLGRHYRARKVEGTGGQAPQDLSHPIDPTRI